MVLVTQYNLTDLEEDNMKEEKKEFKKAEVEVIRFEKTDIITASGTGDNPPPFIPEDWELPVRP